MCGRYTVTVTLEELMLRFMLGDSIAAKYAPRYNIAPGQWIPSIIGGETVQERRLGELRWGLVPNWSKDEKSGANPINLRAETVTEKPSFQRLLTRKRCLIPSDGFYEWNKTGKSSKQPIRFTLKDGALFGMAGLYDTWIQADGGRLHTCTIITTTPNRLVASIHERMPVILNSESESIWLDRTITDVQRLKPLLAPYPAELMTSYEVDPKVGNVRYDEPDCIAPLHALW
ncbi:SOS response-associated peptidase [Paenibacillus sp. UNC451MF]|uniref:SOS response-associated peptidase n=1 Tax=Paenibacillus sp. UNC451MF TaxID=1449063 RepID=UPI00049177B6|nr:SOS response-associated peptidase [Paenibacillus sp. UNC451MF]